MLRLQSLGLVLVGSVALLALAFLVVLGPLILGTVESFAPGADEGARPSHGGPPRHRGVHARGVACSPPISFSPPTGRDFIDLAPGVALTFVASIAFGEAFGAYLGQFVRNYISTYAGLASAMIALVYLYWVALLFVFGGELNAAIMRDRAKRADPQGL